MSTAVQPTLTGASIAEGLRDLANLFEGGTYEAVTDALARRQYPDQAVQVMVQLADTAAVQHIADAMGVEVDDDPERPGVILPLGRGARPDSSMAEMSSAVLLTVFARAAKEG